MGTFSGQNPPTHFLADTFLLTLFSETLFLTFFFLTFFLILFLALFSNTHTPTHTSGGWSLGRLSHPKSPKNRPKTPNKCRSHLRYGWFGLINGAPTVGGPAPTHFPKPDSTFSHAGGITHGLNECVIPGSTTPHRHRHRWGQCRQRGLDGFASAGIRAECGKYAKEHVLIAFVPPMLSGKSLGGRSHHSSPLTTTHHRRPPPSTQSQEGIHLHAKCLYATLAPPGKK